MEVKTGYTTCQRLRNRAIVFWILSGVLIIVSVSSILLYRNPWFVYRKDAAQLTSEELISLADSSSPYVEINGMELTFTGYYKVDNKGEVCSYCYIGIIGDKYLLVDIPATDQGALVEDAASENRSLINYTVTGQLRRQTEMTSWLAEAENVSIDEYREYYHMSDVELYVYGNDQERFRIYQLMSLVLAVGILAIGCIFWSESKIAEAEVQEDED